MIRIPINLASEPFEARRAPTVALGAVCAVLALTLAGQVWKSYSERGQAAAERVSIARLSRELAAAQADQGRLNATLREPGNAQVLERSLFLNTLIDRKAISWTKLFSDLEDVLPYNVRLIAVRLPQIDARNRVLLDMVVGANEPGPVLDLLRKLEASPRFGPASVYNSLPPSQTEKLLRYRISVRYVQKL